jgi:hypothetical protein
MPTCDRSVWRRLHAPICFGRFVLYLRVYEYILAMHLFLSFESCFLRYYSPHAAGVNEHFITHQHGNIS